MKGLSTKKRSFNAPNVERIPEMNKETQETKVLKYLKQRTGKPVCRIELGRNLWILDVPKVISNLKKKGYKVFSNNKKPAHYTYYEMTTKVAI